MSTNKKKSLQKTIDDNKVTYKTKNLSPTRYGDWQHKGKVTDF